MADNLLLHRIDPPPYANIELQHLDAAITHLIDENRQAFQAIIVRECAGPSWGGLYQAVAALDVRLADVFRTVTPLYLLGGDWAAAVDACYLKVQLAELEKYQRGDLFACYQMLSIELADGDPACRAAVALEMQRFRLAGAPLGSATQARLVEIRSQTLALEEAFALNLANARQTAAAQLNVSLDEAPLKVLLAQSEDRGLRERAYKASQALASELDAGPDNARVFELMSRLRQEEARLLGFANAAELSLESKCAASPEQVVAMLTELRHALWQPFATQHAALQTQARALGLEALEPWDVDHLLYRTQGPGPQIGLEVAITALLELASTLFGLTLRENPDLPAWHPDVRVFEAIRDGEAFGYLYMDLLARPEKPDLTMTLGLWNQFVPDPQRKHKAAAVMVCCIEPGKDGAPALLQHLDLRKLYHEFGHCLHRLLVCTPTFGLSDVERMGHDGQEFFGELLERWCFDAPYLSGLVQQDVTAFLESLRAQDRLTLAEDLVKALFDLRWHLGDGRGLDANTVYAQVHEQVLPWALPAYRRPVSGFDHLVSGYAAGYYAYLWARLHALDAFGRFQREGVLNPETGEALRVALMEPGNARPFAEGFGAFMGREMSHQAFLDWFATAN